jgi:hypothetical protein
MVARYEPSFKVFFGFSLKHWSHATADQHRSQAACSPGIFAKNYEGCRDAIYVSRSIQNLCENLPKDLSESDLKKKLEILNYRFLTSFTSSCDDLELARLLRVEQLEKELSISSKTETVSSVKRLQSEIKDRVMIEKSFRESEAKYLKVNNYLKAAEVASRCLSQMQAMYRIDISATTYSGEQLYSIRLVPHICLILFAASKDGSAERVDKILNTLERIIDDYSPFHLDQTNKEAEDSLAALERLFNEPRLKGRLRNMMFILRLKNSSYETSQDLLNQIALTCKEEGKPRDAFKIRACAGDFYQMTMHPELSPKLLP